MKTARLTILILAALALASGHAFSERGREPRSRSRAFSIDGRRFQVGDPGVDDYSPVHRAAAGIGVDTRPFSDNLAKAIGMRGIEPLLEQASDRNAPRLPEGLEPDRVLRLETVDGPVEITLGRVAGGQGSVLGRLRSAGWKCDEPDTRGATIAVARTTNEKEAPIVFLEKGQGRFLSIRRAVR